MEDIESSQSSQGIETKQIAFKNSSLLPSGAIYTVEVEIAENGAEFIQSYVMYPDGTQGVISSFNTEKPVSLTGKVHVQKYVSPSPKAGDCYGPVYGECVDQREIICVFSGDKTQDAENYLKNNCKDSRGKSKKC